MIHESIVDPNTVIAKGFPAERDAARPTNTTQPEELEDLVQYLIESHLQAAAPKRAEPRRPAGGRCRHARDADA